MTPTEFRDARTHLGLSTSELAAILGVDSRTVRKWEDTRGDESTNARPPNPVASRVMRWLLDGYRPPEWHENVHRAEVR